MSFVLKIWFGIKSSSMLFKINSNSIALKAGKTGAKGAVATEELSLNSEEEGAA